MKTTKYKGTVLLLLIATGIWGGIAYQIVDYSKQKKNSLLVPSMPQTTIQKFKDTLCLNYRDPFLGNLPKKPIIQAGIGSRTSPVAIDVPPPSFRFAGKIRKGKKSSLVIVSETETRLFAITTHSIEGYRIVKIYNDSLLVSKGKKTFRLCIE